MTTVELIAWLRRYGKTGVTDWRDGIPILKAADMIEALEERVAIMMEGCQITEDRYQQMRMEMLHGEKDT